MGGWVGQSVRWSDDKSILSHVGQSIDRSTVLLNGNLRTPEQPLRALKAEMLAPFRNINSSIGKYKTFAKAKHIKTENGGWSGILTKAVKCSESR